jgi:hypothetical protein
MKDKQNAAELAGQSPRRPSLIIGMRTHFNGLNQDTRRPPRTLAEQPDTVSAARLAAEAAFVTPPVKSAALAVPVQIVAVRRRVCQPQNLQQPPTTRIAEQPAAKIPRVFRLEEAKGEARSPGPHEDTLNEPAHHRSPVDAVKRPGPVLRIVAAVQLASVTAAATPHAAQPSPREQLDRLRLVLAELELTFAQIRSAQAFKIELPIEG